MIRFLFILTLVIASPLQAMACSCSVDSSSEEASKKNIKKAALIFEGRTLKITESDGDMDFSEINIRIDKIFKGDEKNKEITVYADTKTSCGILPLPLKKQKFFMLYKLRGKYVLASGCGAYISDKDMNALKKGAYIYHQPNRIEFPLIFKDREALEKWAKKTTIGGGEVKEIKFNGINIIMLSRMFSSGIVISDLSLYTMKKSGEYKLIGSYPYVIYDSIEIKQTPEILAFSAKSSGEILLEIAASGVLGRSCTQKSDCKDGQYCIKNDYSDVKGICMPCPTEKDSFIPDQCK